MRLEDRLVKAGDRPTRALRSAVPLALAADGWCRVAGGAHLFDIGDFRAVLDDARPGSA